MNKTKESKFWEESKEQKNTEKFIRELEIFESTPDACDLMGSKFRRKRLFGATGALCTMKSSFYMLFLRTPIFLCSLRGMLTEKEADACVGTKIQTTPTCALVHVGTTIMHVFYATNMNTGRNF